MTEFQQQPEHPVEDGIPDDQQVVRDLRTRPEEGLRALLSVQGERVRRALERGLGGRSDLVDDAIMRAAQQLWQHPGRFSPARGGLGQYFFSIARNFARKSLRKERVERELLAGTGERTGELPPRSPEQERLMSDLRGSITRLGPLQRAIVSADLAEGGSAPAEPIARAFGTSTNSVYVSRRKAYARLRKLLGELGHFQEEGGA